MSRPAGGGGGVEPAGGIPRGLGEDLERGLAIFAGMSRLAIEASIALMPLGDRLRLATYGIIDEPPDTDLAEAGWPSEFAVTPEGLEVIALCAARWPSELEEHGVDVEASDPETDRQLDEVFEEIFGVRQRPD
jgi:hypothetical protein